MKYKAKATITYNHDGGLVTITYETDVFEAPDIEEARHIAYKRVDDWIRKKKLGINGQTTLHEGYHYNGDIGISEIEE